MCAGVSLQAPPPFAEVANGPPPRSGEVFFRKLDPPCVSLCPAVTLNHMVQYALAPLDASFAALSDATRRGVLERLERAEASISDLAEAFAMTLTGMKKHVGVLERAGLVTTEKVGRVRTCRLGQRGLEAEAAWIARYRERWAARFEALDRVVEQLKEQERIDGTDGKQDGRQ